MQPSLAQPPDLPGEPKNPVPQDPDSAVPSIRSEDSISAEHTPEPGKVKTTSTDKHEGLRSILTTIGILILAPIIALLLTAFIFQSYQVDGSSMETTLQNADRLIVYKLPKTWSKITGHAYQPNRGDVIIFNKENLYEFESSGSKKQLVKRVIGLPGDRVVVKDGKVTVYNSQNPNGFDPDESMPYGKVIVTTNGTVDTTVGEDQVFVMGDNRENSLDSRIFGPISDEEVVGKLAFRIFPFNKFKKF